MTLNNGLQAGTPLCVSDEGIHCFDRTGLGPSWQRHQGRTTHSPAAIGDLILAGGSQGVTAFSRDGAPRWQLLDHGHAFTPTVVGNELYFGTLSGVLARASIDGRVLWVRQFTGWLYSPAVVADVVVSGGQSGVLHALRRDTGATLWERRLDQELVNRPVAIDDRHLAATTFAGTLMKLDGQTGRTVWRRSFGVPSKTPVVADGRLVCVLFDGRVAAVAMADGELLWETALPGAVEVAAEGKWGALHNEDELVVFDMQRGETLWHGEFTESIVNARWLGHERIVVFLRGARNQVRAEAVYPSHGTRHLEETEE